MNLRWFWFELVPSSDLPPGVRLGCGVTAYDLNDARRILRERVFGGNEPPAVTIVEDVDLPTPAPAHSLQNMLPPSNRGFWFPLGYPGGCSPPKPPPGPAAFNKNGGPAAPFLLRSRG